MDKRWKQLGELLVNYSTEVKPDERVMIAMVEIETYPLARSIYEACIKAGAYPQIQFLSEELNRLVLKYGNEKQLNWVPEIEAYGMKWADVYFGLRGAHNLNVFWDISSDKLALLRKAMGKVSTMRWEETRWCLLRVPNPSFAQQVGVDEESIEDMFFNACLLDWPKMSKKWQRWVDILNKGKHLRLVGKETDLSFSYDGHNWLVIDGKINMPDGEICTSPNESTVNGQIYFENPGVLGGRLMHDIRLRWENGKLVEASSSSNQDFLQAVINTDPGASRIGEFAFGTNPELTRFCNDILIDEKIYGTIHIALGRSYPSTGGKNKSAIHWDIVKDLRQEGQVYVDGKLVFDNGQILL